MESGDSEATGRCTFCGAAVASETGVETVDERFCSAGCRDLHRDLGSPPDVSSSRDDTPAQTHEKTSDGDDEIVRTHFRVDGMYSAHCEAYLESVATGREGVADASASYVTESVRVDHDPDRISPAALEDALTGLGYTAYRRDRSDEPAVDGSTAAEDRPIDADVAGETHRDREMSGHRKRRSDDFLEMRYVVGVVFGSFLLIPYVVLFYPATLAELTGWEALSMYAGSVSTLDWGVLPLFLVLTGAILYLTGRPLLRGAYLSVRLRTPNAHLLATLPIVAAYLYGIVAILAERVDLYFDLTILVAALVMGAIYWEATVKRDAVSRLTDLTRATVAEARRFDPDGTTDVVPTEVLSPGDRILVRQGERIPVDGELVEGSCTVEEALLTGESLPQERTPGDAVVGGSTVTSGSAVVAVGDRPTSRLQGLTRAVWDLQSATHGASNRADELAQRALPLVVGLAAVVTAATLVRGGGPVTAVRHLLLTLIVASPWAFAFATPVSVATSLREAAARGVVVFDETVFERLRRVDAVVFDKTGTLTTGEMTVLDSTGSSDVLTAAGALERRASHPAADAIVDAFGLDGEGVRADGGTPDRESTVSHDGEGVVPRVRSFETHPTGVSGEVDGEATLVGHPSLFAERGWTVDESVEARVDAVREAGHLPVVVGQDGRAVGVVTVGDRPRESWAETVDSLSERDVDVVVLTGDDASATSHLADHDGISTVYASVPPAGKTAAIRGLAGDGRVAMVGDGTNDAPALAAADLGIALGSGTALAADAADLAIADDDLAGVDRAFALADRARRRRRGTLGVALSYNAIAGLAGLAGLMSPLATTVGVVVAAGAVLGYASNPIGGGR